MGRTVPSGMLAQTSQYKGVLGTNPDKLEKNLIRAEVCGGEGMRSCFAMASVRASGAQCWSTL
jgi:hypothetical protein